MKEETLNRLIKERKNRASRIERSDISAPREKYQSHLPLKYRSYISRANSKGLGFDLTVEEFDHLLNQDCAYCGCEKANGVDRVDSKGSYTKDNVLSCCGKCNMMKFTHSKDEFLNHIKKIYIHQET